MIAAFIMISLDGFFEGDRPWEIDWHTVDELSPCNVRPTLASRGSLMHETCPAPLPQNRPSPARLTA
jgi:hypothetical protein